MRVGARVDHVRAWAARQPLAHGLHEISAADSMRERVAEKDDSALRSDKVGLAFALQVLFDPLLGRLRTLHPRTIRVRGMTRRSQVERGAMVVGSSGDGIPDFVQNISRGRF